MTVKETPARADGSAVPGPGGDGTPAGAGAGELRDRKTQLFRAIPAADPRRGVRGRYDGHTDVSGGVAKGSVTETFLTLRLEIDNWRWAAVPIFLRAGKALAERVAEVRVALRRTPRPAFLPTPTQVEPNQIVLRIDPDPGLRLQIVRNADQPWRPVHPDTCFAAELGERSEPYRAAAARRADRRPPLPCPATTVGQTWRIVEPLLLDPPPIHPYPRGSGGRTPRPRWSAVIRAGSNRGRAGNPDR